MAINDPIRGHNERSRSPTTHQRQSRPRECACRLALMAMTDQGTKGPLTVTTTLRKRSNTEPDQRAALWAGSLFSRTSTGTRSIVSEIVRLLKVRR